MKPTRQLLICGIVSPLVYAGTDILAGLRYPGYSFQSQAVSELFAIGAPTSALVVSLFSVGSMLSLVFAFGVWWTAGERRVLRVLAVLLALSAVDGLLLWNVFPMHMRGAERTFTDTMHLVLAANPFVPLSLVFGMVAFKRGFRIYSAVTIVMLLVLADLSFSYAPQLDANLPTPWLGLTERVAQWAYGVWQLVLAGLLIQQTHAPKREIALTSPVPLGILPSRSGRTRVRAKD